MKKLFLMILIIFITGCSTDDAAKGIESLGDYKPQTSDKQVIVVGIANRILPSQFPEDIMYLYEFDLDGNQKAVTEVSNSRFYDSRIYQLSNNGMDRRILDFGHLTIIPKNLNIEKYLRLLLIRHISVHWDIIVILGG